MPYENEHAARVRNPGDFQPDSFRRKNVADGVDLIIGKPKGESAMTAQAYRFKREKFTPAEAKAWLKDNKVKYISFENATGGQMDEPVNMSEWVDGLMLADKNSAPRREIMIFPFGEFEHPQYGKLKFDAEFFSDIIDNYESNVLGTKPFMDVEHKMGEALAWFDTVPYIRQGIGLFARPNWTDAGSKMLESNIYRYFSPWYEDFTDPSTGRKYSNVWRGGAATNIPFLKTMPAMVEGKAKMSETVNIQLSEIPGFSDAIREHEAGTVKTATPGKVVPDNNITKEVGKMKELAKLLGVAEDAEESAFIEAVKKLSEEIEAVKKALDDSKKKTEIEDGVNKELEAAKKELAEVKLQVIANERDKHIGKALSEGKITPAKKDFWEKRFLADPAGVKEIIENMEPVVKLGESGAAGEGSGEETDPGRKLVMLADKMVAEKKMSFQRAFEEVGRQNPELLAEYGKAYSTRQ